MLKKKDIKQNNNKRHTGKKCFKHIGKDKFNHLISILIFPFMCKLKLPIKTHF